MKNIYLYILVVVIALSTIIYFILPQHRTCQYSSKEINELENKANNGDRDAAWKLYGCYEEDNKLSLHWLKVGAKAGDPRAKYILYSVLINKGEHDSILLLMDAANLDYTLAQRDLAELYVKGTYWNKDIDAAIYWYHRAAKLNDKFAMLDLAKILSSQKNRQNTREACIWARKAATSAEMKSSFYRDIQMFLNENCTGQ